MFGKDVTKLTDEEYKMYTTEKERRICTESFIAVYPEDTFKRRIVERKLWKYGVPYIIKADRNANTYRFYTPPFKSSDMKMELLNSIGFHCNLKYLIQGREEQKKKKYKKKVRKIWKKF